MLKSPGSGPFVLSVSVDLSASGPSTRLNLANTVLSPSGNTTNIWENFSSAVTLNGPGQANGEITIGHFDFTVSSGALAALVENIEIKTTNAGSISAHNGLLNFFNNAAAGVVTANTYGVKFQLTNANPAAGAIANYSAIDLEPMAGGGSVPTGFYLIRGADANATIATLGTLSVGNLSAPTGSNVAVIQGKDLLNTSFPFVLKNSGGGNLFYVSNAGSMTLGVNSASAHTVNGSITSTGVITPLKTTVALLPAAAGNQGARAFVTDATVTTFASAVVGGGANPVPVYSDGTTWRIG